MKSWFGFFILFELIFAGIAVGQDPASQTSAAGSQAAENPDINYHMVVLLPQYRFVSTNGYGGRVGEYDSLQQSLGGDMTFDAVSFPQRLSVKSSASFLSRDDYDWKSQMTVGQWLDFGLTLAASSGIWTSTATSMPV